MQLLTKLIAICVVVGMMVLLTVFGERVSEFTLMTLWFFGAVPAVYFIWRVDA